jgi:hypothetical protein
LHGYAPTASPCAVHTAVPEQVDRVWPHRFVIFVRVVVAFPHASALAVELHDEERSLTTAPDRAIDY